MRVVVTEAIVLGAVTVYRTTTPPDTCKKGLVLYCCISRASSPSNRRLVEVVIDVIATLLELIERMEAIATLNTASNAVFEVESRTTLFTT